MMFVETIKDLGFMVSHNLDWKYRNDKKCQIQFLIFYAETFH